jgi:hypothetical protein
MDIKKQIAQLVKKIEKEKLSSSEIKYEVAIISIELQLLLIQYENVVNREYLTEK